MAAGVGMAMTLVSGALSAYGSYQQGKAAQYNAEYNAKLAENQAKQEELEGRENARRQIKNNEQQLSAARARFANQGSIATSGAPIAVMGDIAAELELGVLDAYRSADANRTYLLNQAKLERFRGKDAARAGKLMAFTGALNTGANLYSNYSTGKSTGLFKGSLMGG